MRTVKTFDANAITGMTGLTERPVFFLKLNHSPTPNVVVKGDVNAQAAAVAIQWGSKLMKNVQNDLANAKVLSAAEILAFKNAVMKYLPGTKQYQNSKNPHTWVKMNFVAGLSDADFLNNLGRVDQNNLAQVIPKLSEAEVWKDLGKVIAVDIFIGNGDRFVVNPRNGAPGSWVNKGNLMFLAAGHEHKTRVIGLDLYDPNSGGQSDLRAPGGFETLKVLTDTTLRDQFAKTTTTSVGAEMKMRMGRSNLASVNVPVQMPDGPGYVAMTPLAVKDLFVPFTNDLAQGIEEGAHDLRQYLTSKVQQYRVAMPLPPTAPAPPTRNIALGAARVQAPARPGMAAPVKAIPQGILDRMRYLNWL